MSSLKYIHAADIHLDSPLRGLERYESAPVDRLRQATRRALENLVELALTEEVDFVLIAGDLYDGDWKDYGTGLFFTKTVARLREACIRVFIVTGNHDAQSHTTKSLQLPPNVQMLSADRAETVELDELGVAIHGQSFWKAKVTDNLARNFPGPLRGYFNIGLLHTSASGFEGHGRYAPCTVEELVDRGYQYWALGHVHQRQELHTEPWVVFPGNIQGRHARETGPKGCSVVHVEDDRIVKVEHRDLDVVRWQICSVDVSEASLAADVPDLFDEALAQILDQDDSLLYALRVQVKGSSDAHGELHARSEHWTHELRNRAATVNGEIWIEKVKISTTARSLDFDADVDGAVGELLACIEELHDDPTALEKLGRELEPLIKKLPPELRDGEDAVDRMNIGSPEFLRQGLDGARHLLLARLPGNEETR
jgi:exonuclease SbcD